MDSSNVTSIPNAILEEDDKLFLATGFRFLPAFERGFPYPWCAKKSKKGWIVRDSPPSLSRQHPEMGVEFVGWREAEKMFRSREVLMQRVKNMERKLLSGTSDALIGPLSERNSMNCGSTNIQHTACCKVHEWFRNTQRVTKVRQMQASEEDFRLSLNRQKEKYRSELREELRERKRRQKESREVEMLQAMPPLPHESPSASLKKSPVEHPPQMSPTRRKHKNMPPKPIQQLRNSVVLGEDPELDQMIEDVVFDFVHEFSKGKDSQANGSARGVEFDGSAMSVLKEAAKDTLHSIANQDVNSNRMGGTHANILTRDVRDAKNEIEKNPEIMNEEMMCAYTGVHSDYQLHDDTDGTDERISAMIEELIGEAQQDSDCQFDQRALDALKEAAKEIVAMGNDVMPE